ncbi:hypothetical protein SCMC78_36330 [Streptomyces sp. CMC78]|uniref:Uncharacterized protein n=1 Tax=Streptomyces sp. CMC78 TaxID=3231512 RepID=A0AB33KEX5_9ACTN|nr:hypothetical protein GCM10010504_13200 [Streptomyces griseus]
MVGVARTGQRPYDNKATGGQLSQPVADQVTKLPLHRGTHDGAPHGLADDETRTWRGKSLPRHVRVRFTAA